MNGASLDFKEYQILRKAVTKWYPQYLPLVSLVGSRPLSEESERRFAEPWLMR